MKCNKAQDMIVTEYLDGCLKEPDRTRLQEHLQECAACRTFLVEAEKTVRVPFESLDRAKMPESVLRSVMQQVAQLEQNSWQARLGDIWQRLREERESSALRLGWAMTGVVCFLLVAGMGAGGYGLEQARQAERGAFLVQVAGVTIDKTRDMADYGTAMESYFLEERGES